MPLNVRRFYTSVLLVLVSFVLAHAQTVDPTAPTQTGATTPAPPAPTAGDIMRGRISKAKAFIVVRNYNAAIYELENIRKESGDAAVQSVVNVLLMNSYLEQGDYKRAQDMLGQFYNEQKTTKANAAASYAAVAGQIIKGARMRAERYKALGLSVSDSTLPLEALNDLEKMRETLELVITQSKEIGKAPAKTRDAMGMLEEAVNSRTMIARDDYDARHWRDEVADTREEMTSSRSVVMDAGTGQPVVDTAAQQVASANTGQPTKPFVQPGMQNVAQSVTQPMMQPVVETKTVREREVKQPDTNTVAKNDKAIYIPSAPPSIKEAPIKPADTPKAETPKTDDGSGPIEVGALLAYATTKTPPIYPSVARTMRTTGTVKVEVTVNESGDVSDIHTTSGPSTLQNAAKDAIRKWKFKPFVRDGQPVKANGFVSFNFSL